MTKWKSSESRNCSEFASLTTSKDPPVCQRARGARKIVLAVPALAARAELVVKANTENPKERDSYLEETYIWQIAESTSRPNARFGKSVEQITRGRLTKQIKTQTCCWRKTEINTQKGKQKGQGGTTRRGSRSRAEGGCTLYSRLPGLSFTSSLKALGIMP